METQLYSAAATAVQGGKVHLEFTEGQLTAAANTELQKQGETRIKDVQIGLDAGLLNLSGTVNQDGFEMPLTHIDEDHRRRPGQTAHPDHYPAKWVCLRYPIICSNRSPTRSTR